MGEAFALSVNLLARCQLMKAEETWKGLKNAAGVPRGRGAVRWLPGTRAARTGKKLALAIITGHVNEWMQLLPEQLNSCFCTSATLRPRSSAGEVHWVNRPTVGLCRSHCANQARWQSQCRLFEWRRLLKEAKWNMSGEAALKTSTLREKTHQIKCLQAPNDTLRGTRTVNGTFHKGEALLNPVFYMAFLECSDCP